MNKVLTSILVLLTSVSGFAQIRIDLGREVASSPAAGWSAWEMHFINLAPLNAQRIFTSTMGTSGSVTVGLISQATEIYARNDGYLGDESFSPETPLELWEDGIMLSGFGVSETAIAITLEGLKAGEYVFTSYAGYRNVGISESKTKIYVNEQYTGLDTTFYQKQEDYTSAAFLEAHVPQRIGFSVINDNDPITIEFRNPTSTSFGLNGFEVHRNFGAFDPYPAIAQTNVTIQNLVLSWSRGRDPNSPQPNPDITKHYLYLAQSEPNRVGEPNLIGVTPIEITDLTDPIEYGPLTLQKEMAYYWRVDSCINNSGPADSNTIPGVTWFFETEKEAPVVTDDIEGLFVNIAATASFEIEFLSVSSPAVQWYKYVDGPNDIELSVGGSYLISTENIVGNSYRSTLDISNTGVGDEGRYYCLISNAGGEVSSSLAALVVKRLVSYYPFDGTLEDMAGPYDGTLKPLGVGEPNYITSPLDLGQALLLDGNKYVDIGSGQPRDEVMRNGSVSLWFSRAAITPMKYMMLFGTFNDGAKKAIYAPIPTTNLSEFALRNDAGQAITWTMNARTAISSNVWYFYTATWTINPVTGKMDVKQYANGTLVRSGTFTDMGAFSWQYPMTLGAGNSRGSVEDRWYGALDEIKFYNYPLSNEEVAQEYVNISGQSVCFYPPFNDLTADCKVDLNDFSKLAAEWLFDGSLSPD